METPSSVTLTEQLAWEGITSDDAEELEEETPSVADTKSGSRVKLEDSEESEKLACIPAANNTHSKHNNMGNAGSKNPTNSRPMLKPNVVQALTTQPKPKKEHGEQKATTSTKAAEKDQAIQPTKKPTAAPPQPKPGRLRYKIIAILAKLLLVFCVFFIGFHIGLQEGKAASDEHCSECFDKGRSIYKRGYENCIDKLMGL